jgi:hypothetical protein
MKLPSKEQIEAAKARYPSGTRVELPNGTADPYSPLPAGTRGTVGGVDDMLNLMVKWDNGSSLNAIIGHDEIRKLTKAEVIKEQAKAVAKTGRTNMFDAKAAFEIALEMDFDELANFIFMDTKRYSTLILTGELDDADLTEWP